MVLVFLSQKPLAWRAAVCMVARELVYRGWRAKSGAATLTLLWLADSPQSGMGYTPGVASGEQQRTVLLPQTTHSRFSKGS